VVFEALDWHAAIGRAEVLAVGEAMRVRTDVPDRVLVTLRDQDLDADGIGLEIDADRDVKVLLAQERGTAKVDEDLRGGERA
jgi:hypothetical protein